MVAALMKQRNITAVVVGADRVCKILLITVFNFINLYQKLNLRLSQLFKLKS